ncbi:MFS transporter, partial [Verrucomicrobia bacterium]|nr:MFS transporter [Verrucomicrobiota bacterium]
MSALMLFGIGILYYFVARDHPEDLGFDADQDDSKKEEENSATNETPEREAETAIEKYRAVLSNGRFMLGCIAIGLQNLARYGLLVWVPVHFLGDDWKQAGGTKWLSVALPIGMA